MRVLRVISTWLVLSVCSAFGMVAYKKYCLDVPFIGFDFVVSLAYAFFSLVTSLFPFAVALYFINRNRSRQRQRNVIAYLFIDVLIAVTSYTFVSPFTLRLSEVGLFPSIITVVLFTAVLSPFCWPEVPGMKE